MIAPGLRYRQTPRHTRALLHVALIALVVGGTAGCGELRELRELRDSIGHVADPDVGPVGAVDGPDASPDTGADTTRPDTGGSDTSDDASDGVFFPNDATDVPEVSFGEPPIVLDVYPPVGPTAGGTLVTVQGARFDWTPEVRLGGTLITSVDVIDQYELLFVTPPMQPGTYDLKVTTNDGTAAYPDAFTAVEALSIDAVEPTDGPMEGGLPVAIDGVGFSRSTRFVFGDREASDVRVVSPVRAEAVLPPSDQAGEVDVLAFDVTLARLPGGFSYFAEPHLEALLPAVGSSDGGELVAVSGRGIDEGCSVVFGTSRVPVERGGDGRWGVLTPGGPVGPVDVSVDCGVRGAEYQPAGFTYTDLEETTILDVSPAVGFTSGGAIVTISGARLGGAETVFFGAEEAAIVDVGDWSVRVVAPTADPGVVSVTVETADGVDAAEDAFEYIQTPRFGGVRPRAGSVDGGWSVIVDGDRLDVVDAVWVDGRRIELDSRGSFEIAFTAPAAPAGDADLVAEAAGLRIDTGFDLSFQDERRFDRFAPTSGPTTGGTVITVFGAGFDADCVVYVGGVAAPTDRVGTFLLAATAPPHDEGRAEVEVIGCGDPWAFSGQFTYFDPAAPPGGVSGGAIDGELSVTVIESGTEVPIEGATVMVGIRDESPWVGLTNSAGQITFRDPDLRGPQTVTAFAPERSAESVVHADAAEVTLVLNRLPVPPCDPATDPDCVPPPPPPTGQIIGFLTGLQKLADPPPGAVVGAVIETTRYAPGYGNPNPGPESVLFDNGPFTITTRLGEMALIAQCGWFLDYGTVDEVFVPRRIGVTRGIFIRGSDGPYRTAVDCNIPLDRSATFKLTNAPELVDEPTPDEVVDRDVPSFPGFYQVDVDFEFGAEGHFETLPPIVSRSAVFTGGTLPALEGVLDGVVVNYTGGVYDLFGTIPYARAYVRRTSSYDRVVTFPAFLPLPTITYPSDDDPRFAGYVEWTYPETARVPDLYHFYVSGQGVDFPRYSIFVPGYQRSLDLADFPEFSEEIGWVPGPGDVGQLVTFYVRAIDIDAFDFDDFDRYVLRSRNWNSVSVSYQTVFLGE